MDKKHLNMVLRLVAILFTIQGSLFTSFAQTQEQMGGVYYTYPVTEISLAEVTEGYEPFYISHYGRHGSRWLTNDNRYIWVNQHFEDQKNLTKLGKDVRMEECQGKWWPADSPGRSPASWHRQEDVSELPPTLYC